MLTEERQSIDAKCTGIDHIIKDGKDVYVAAEVSKHQLKDFLATQKLEKQLKGALAYSLTEIVQEIHEHGIHNNNIAIERLSIYEDGTLCMLSNYASGTHEIKQVQPSTQKTIPSELIETLPKKRQALDTFKTAMAIHEIFTGEKIDMTTYSYKKDSKVPRNIFNTLRNVLDKERRAKYTRPHWLSRRIKEPDTNYLLKELKTYSHYCDELKEKMSEFCKSRN